MSPLPERGRYPVPDLVPHRGIARLLTAIVSVEPGFIDALGEIPAAYPLVADGRAPCFVGIELAAQAAAALGALGWREEGREHEARIGYLVRVREAELLRPQLPIETPLRVTARVEASMQPLAILRVAVSVGGADFLRALISTFSESR
jgi:predicted hotdog family 3-hydroxylacyl-ACP dehydratase